MILNRTEVRQLTKCRQRGKCIEWLEDKGYPHDIGADGWPVVLWSFVNARLGGVSSPKAEPELRLD